MVRLTNRDAHSPIDIVIPWVDGSDPHWQEERLRYLPEPVKATDGSSGIRRYRDWDNLQYVFRGIEAFAPWVRTVHFVTWGHVPEWLDINAPKLHIVRHADYIPEKYLPTFSSHPIELNLHRIPGIAEQFVYFNDDTFLLKPTRPTDFFVDGKPRDCAALNAISLPRDTMMAAQIYNTRVINQHFSKNSVIRAHPTKWLNIRYGSAMLRTVCLLPWPRFTGFMEPHLPTSLLKSTFEQVWAEEPEVLDQTCSHKFRSVTDVNQWLIRDWQLVTGNFVPRSEAYGKRYMKIVDHEIHEVIVKQKYHMACFNDFGSEDTFEEEKALLQDGLQHILPDRCSFERPDCNDVLRSVK